MTLSDSFWIKQPWLLGTGLNSTQMAHTKVWSTQPPSLFALGLLHAALSLFEHWRKQRCLNRRGSTYNWYPGFVWLQTKVSTMRLRLCCLSTSGKNEFACQSVVYRLYLHVHTNLWKCSACHDIFSCSWTDGISHFRIHKGSLNQIHSGSTRIHCVNHRQTLEVQFAFITFAVGGFIRSI